MEITPFSNATEFECWLSSNCYNCEKYYKTNNEEGYSICEIEIVIAEASITGSVYVPIALRMGMVRVESGWQHTSCKEVIPLQKWHVIGEADNKKALLFGPFDSVDKAAFALLSAPWIIEEVNSYSKINLSNLKLDIEQTNTQVIGEIDRFIEHLTINQLKKPFNGLLLIILLTSKPLSSAAAVRNGITKVKTISPGKRS